MARVAIVATEACQALSIPDRGLGNGANTLNEQAADRVLEVDAANRFCEYISHGTHHDLLAVGGGWLQLDRVRDDHLLQVAFL